MSIFIKHGDMSFEDHPRFPGVRIAKLIGRDQDAPIGVSILEISPSVEIPIHVHDNEIDSIHCLEGRGELFDGNDWLPLSRGDYCFVPKGERHGVRNTGDDLLVLFIVHSPPLF